MTWPEHVLEKFHKINPGTTQSSEYYGPYNMLLTYLFPSEEGYEVAPRFEDPDVRDSIHFDIMYVVLKNAHPVFFLQISPPGAFDHRGGRGQADDRMRSGLFKLYGFFVAPRLYGICALGTRLAVYELDRDTGRFTPKRILQDSPDILTDCAPSTRWNHELFSAEGEEKIRAIVQDIKTMQ